MRFRATRRLVPAVVGVSLLAAHALAADHAVEIARLLPATRYDRDLPGERTDAWIAAHLPDGYLAQWGPAITDCGEGTGTPADVARDMPLCAEVEIRQARELRGYLLLFIGTRQRGILPGEATLFSGYLTQAGRERRLHRLGDLALP